MKKVQVIIGLLFLSGSVILIGSGLAATQPGIERNVIGSAGGEVTAPGNLYHLNGTLGEPIAGDFAQAATYGLRSGFWANTAQNTPTSTPTNTPTNIPTNSHLYLPLIIKSN